MPNDNGQKEPVPVPVPPLSLENVVEDKLQAVAEMAYLTMAQMRCALAILCSIVIMATLTSRQ